MHEWLPAHERDLAINPVVLGEFRFGILLLPRGKKRAALERWFDAGQPVPFVCLGDAETGVKWAELLARLRRVGKAMPIKDSLIAATRFFTPRWKVVGCRDAYRHDRCHLRPSAEPSMDSNQKINDLRRGKTRKRFVFSGKFGGSPAWIRTTIHGSKGRCPTIRRPGNVR